MKKILVWILAFVMAFSIIGCGDTTGSQGIVKKKDGFLVGFGKADITPYEQVNLGGYGDDGSRISQGFVSMLYALSVVITDEEDNTLILIVTDLSWGDEERTRMVRKAIAEEYGISSEYVMLGGTHNHSGPAYNNASLMVKNYLNYWLEGVMDSVAMAMEDRKPSQMQIGSTETENLTFVRRYIQEDGNLQGDNYKISDSPLASHETEADEEVQMVRFVREEGKDILITNWQSHANYASNTKNAGSDWVGPLRDKVENELDVHCIYFQGAAGNLNPKSRLEGENKTKSIKEHGEAIADYVIAAYKDESVFTSVNTGLIEVKQATFTGKVNKSEDNKLEIAEQIYSKWKNTSNYSLCVSEGLPHGIHSPYHAGAIISRNKESDTKDMELNTISIGDVSIVTFPTEMFDVSGMQIKDQTPYEMTLLMGYSCGIHNYTPDVDGFARGGYEADNGLFESGTAEKIVEEYLKTLKELHK